jgi:hypothetical protein
MLRRFGAVQLPAVPKEISENHIDITIDDGCKNSA